MPKPKPATLGEWEVCKVWRITIDELRTLESCRILRKLARRFDVVVKRAFEDGRFYEYQASVERPAVETVQKYAAKYGVKARHQ